jgi:hypothetical protein
MQPRSPEHVRSDPKARTEQDYSGNQVHSYPHHLTIAGRLWHNSFTVRRPDNPKAKPDFSDAEVRDILVHAMADVGADPALVYAFQKTGVYVCEENEKCLPPSSIEAFDGAVDEYLSAVDERPIQ